MIATPHIGLLLLAVFPGLFYGFMLFTWLRKQSIYSAWLLALFGLMLGPGLILFYGVLGDGVSMEDYLLLLLLLCAFYWSLIVGNNYMKKGHPNNALAA